MAASTTRDANAIRNALRRVIDPEVGVNIVDLGLVYKVDSTPGEVHIELTMTSPACPLADVILDDVDRVLDAILPMETELRLDMVWDPPWTPELMSPEARAHFGWKK